MRQEKNTSPRDTTIVSTEYANEEEYWLNQLSGQLTRSYFPYDYPYPGGGEPHTQALPLLPMEFPIPGDSFNRLLKLSKGIDYTLHMIFTAVVVVMLDKYIYGKKNGIIVGVPIYKQDSTEDFINTVLTIRSQPRDTMTFKELLIDVRQTIIKAEENQNYPLEVLLSKLDLPPGGDDFPLFDTAVLMESIHDKKYLDRVQLNMIFSFSRTGESGQVILEYNPTRYDKTTVKRIINRFLQLLHNCLLNMDNRLEDIDMLTRREKQEILIDFNHTKEQYPRDKTIVELFTEQVSRFPDRTAVVCEDEAVTYGHLNQRTIGLAGFLRNKGVGPDTIVAIMEERSPDTIIGILGILTAGGAYLPLAPEMPQRRIISILNDAGVRHRDVIKMDELEKQFPVAPDENIKLINRSGHLAYVIYTSGSTGTPKGVMIRHHNVNNLVLGLNRCIYQHHDPGKALNVAQVAPYVFDASIKQVFGALLQGHNLHIVPEEARLDSNLLWDSYIRHQIDISDGTPIYIKLMLETMKEYESETGSQPIPVKRFIIGGEALPAAVVKDFLNSYRGAVPRITNIYGLTECTVDSTSYEVNPGNLDTYRNIPIAKPMPNTVIYIVSIQDQPQPIGVPGELCIGGDGIGRGYLNNPELTAEKFYLRQPGGRGMAHGAWRFAHSPSKNFSLLPHSPIYLTGDLARWLPDGNIEFSGRIDQQVKIRGYRIELEEIENHLQKNKKISQAVVVAGSDIQKQQYLCAYIVPNPLLATPSGSSLPVLQPGEIREYLLEYLPDYMVPTHYIQLQEIPLNQSGKLDRRALPEPRLTDAHQGVYAAPRDDVEEALAQLWARLFGIEKQEISINADFFELGGHSLRATMLIARIHKELDVKIPLVEMFKTPTIKGLAKFIRKTRQIKHISIPRVEKKEYYPMSPAMKRLYFEQQVNPDSPHYNIPMIAWLEGELDRQHLERCFRKIIRRHETLRTSFVTMDDEPVQKISGSVEFAVDYLDLPLSPGDIIENFTRPFDLSRAPLFRVYLVHTEPHRHILAVEVHHMAADGTSVGLLMKDFMALYSGETLPLLPIRYRDYSEWKNNREHQALMLQQEAYWLEQFQGDLPVMNLPCDYSRPPVKSFEGTFIRSSLEIEETKQLRELARTEDVTLYMLLAAIFILLLAKLTGLEDIIIGTPAAGRHHTDLEPLVGMFVNTLVLRNYPSGNKTFKEFLAQLKKRTLQAFAHQEYNFEDLVQQVVPVKDVSRSPITDVFFALQNMEMPEVQIPGLRLRPYQYERKTARFDLSFIMMEDGHQLQVYAEYSTKLFNPQTIARLIDFLKKIAALVLKDPLRRISAIDIISGEEKHKVLCEFNDTFTQYPREKTIHQLFQEQARRTPHQVALVEEEGKDRKVEGKKENVLLTYKELNETSNQLAYLLKEKGVEADAMVGLMMERSAAMIIGILGILKAGGAYLPIDPDYPEERLKYMLKDGKVNILVKKGNKFGNLLAREGIDAISIDDVSFYSSSPEAFKVCPKGAPSFGIWDLEFGISPRQAGQLAYLIYTSGTTGDPKGVMVEHVNVVRLVKNTNYIQLREGNRLLQTGAPEFDASTFETWGVLLNGLQLYLVSNEIILSAKKLKDTLQKNRITTMWLTSPLFNQLLEQDIKIFKGLKNLLVGGDVLSPLHINRLRHESPALNIINGYDPTENTTFSTTYLIDKEHETSIPIGKPIANSTVFILDSYQHLQPINVPGEIWVGGDGVARGYVNDPELTSERFINYKLQNTNKKVPGKGIHMSYFYRTGDLAKWLPDGNIRFIGRIDQQVKIRGFRVELEEIRSQLLKHEKVKEAVIVIKEFASGNDADKTLCAYVVLVNPPDQVSSIGQELREYLSFLLPYYMIPSFFVTLDQIPLTSNGKVDKKSLPAPHIDASDVYTSPRNRLEEKLVEIWVDLLKVSPIGIDDNFFQLGGHSLKATLLISRILRLFHVQVPLVELFENPCIRHLAYYIETTGPGKQMVIQPAEKRDYYPLSSAQKRLYYLQWTNPQSTLYNVPTILRLGGKIDKQAMEQTLEKLVHQHESLRTSFRELNGVPVQQIHSRVKVEIEYIDWEKESGKEQEELGVLEITRHFIRSFDLSCAPLLRIGLARTGPDEQVLAADVHHIISDGVSSQILSNQCLTLYRSGATAALQEIPVQYKDYCLWQNSPLQKEIMKKQELYWLNRFKEDKGEIPVLEIPLDYPRPRGKTGEGAYINFDIEPAAAERLRAIALSQDATLFMIVLTLFNILLHKLSWQEDIILGTVNAGRRHQDLENIVGMFVNTLVLRNHPQEEKSFSQFLKEVRQTTLEAFDNQDYQFDDLVEKLVVKRVPGRNPLFDVMFMFGSMDIQNPFSPISAAPIPTSSSTAAPTLKPLEISGNQAKFDILFTGADNGDKFVFSFGYSTELFTEQTIKEFIKYFKQIIDAIVENKSILIKQISISHDLAAAKTSVSLLDRESFEF